MIFWALGLLIAGSQLAVYTELASFFPNRSGAEVVYLEQAYPRPKYLLPTAFAVQSVILSFSSSNAIGNELYCPRTYKLLTFSESDGSVPLCDRGIYPIRMGAERPRRRLYYFYYFMCVVPHNFRLAPSITDKNLVVIFSTKWSLRLSNAVGVIKIITLLL